MSEGQAEKLFDQVELVISLEAGMLRLKQMEASGLRFWTSFGRFIWRNGNALSDLENLPDSDPIYAAGLLGGSKAAATPTFQEVRKFYKEAARYARLG